MKTGLVVLAVSMLLTSSAFAQTTATSKPEPSPEKAALAHQIIVASGGEAQMRARLVQMLAATNKLSTDVLPTSARITTTEIMTEFQASFLDAMPQLVALAERAYADNLSEQEMRDYAAWLSSPTGQSIRNKSGAISTQIIIGEGPMLREMMPRLIQKAIDRVCQRTGCSSDDRTVIAAAMAKAMSKG